MRALAVNLKTLVQCPALWFFHAIGMLLFVDTVLGPVLEPVAGRGEFMKFLVVSFWTGMVITSMMKEMLGRPLAFCLPRHQETVRTTIFAVGGVLSLLLSLIALAYPGLEGAAILAAMASIATLAMTAYLVTASVMLLVPNASILWGIPIAFFGLFRNLKLFNEVRVAMEDVALFHPLANAVVLIPVAALTWYWMVDRSLARKQCGVAFMALQYFWSGAAQERYGLERRLARLNRHSKRLWGWIEDRFLARMRRLPAYTGRRHSTGSRYVLFGSTVPLSPTGVALGTLAIVMLVVFLGFIAPVPRHEGFSNANFLYIAPCIVGMTVLLPLYSTLLVPAGRKERFRSCLSIGIHGAVVVLVASVALCAVSIAVGAMLPEITLSGNTFTYLPMDPELAFSPLLMLPLLYACQIGFPRSQQIAQTVVLIVGASLGIAVPGTVLAGLGLVTLAILAVPCWWCFVGPLHHLCFHRDLALN